jgi:hypothetical protein
MRLWRSLDLVVTLVVALTVGVLGTLNVVSDSVLAGATLATLGVLALGTLIARLQMQSLAATNVELVGFARRHLAEPPSADRLLTVSTSGVDVDLACAGDIGIIGVTLNRTIRNHIGALQQCVRRGGTARIAVIDPAGGVTAEAARRSTMPGSADIFAHRLVPTLDLLRELAAMPGLGRVEIRLLGFVPAFGLLMVDGPQPHGHVHVDIYSHAFGGQEPALVVRAGRDQVWYQHFVAEFEQIWSAGRPLGERPHAEFVSVGR